MNRDPRDIHRLGKVLLSSTHAPRRALAAESLGEMGYRSAYGYLRLALWDDDETVRMRVVEAIGRLGVRQCAGELTALYAYASPTVRRELVRAAASIGGDEGFSDMLRFAERDPDRRVRHLAERTKVKRGA